MKVTVTGGAGFLGRHVVTQLEQNGHDVFVPRSSVYDLRRLSGVVRALSDGAPEVVIHLAAAVGGIGANQAHPGSFLHDNAVMGLLLMEQARSAEVEKFLTIGTACEYPAAAPLPLREEDIWNGFPAAETAPYGLAKRLLLAQGQAFRQEYGFDVIHLIPTNLYGPGDSFDPETGHVIPSLVRRFSDAVRKGEPVVRCWGSGKATREFLYVEDAATAIVMAAERYDSAEPMNIGTGVETSLKDLARLIADLCGFEGWIEWDTTRPTGVDRRRLDIGRAWEAMGFLATTSLEAGLKATVEWYEGQAA